MLRPPEVSSTGCGRIALGAGAAVVAGVTAADAALGADVQVIGGVVVGPLVAALAAPARAVAVLGALAAALALMSAAWNANLGEVDWVLRALYVVIGSVAAWAAARARTAARAVQSQLHAVLSSLAEAVIVQDAAGRIVFANQAAAELTGLRTPEEVLSETGEAVAARWEARHEDGRPVDPEDLPGRRVLAGDDAPPPLLVRARNPDTGEERWRFLKATGVRDPGGDVRFAVNVVDDVTEVKRREMRQRLLSEASRILAGSLDSRTTLSRVAAAAVPELADWCFVHVPGERGRLDLVEVAHADEALAEQARANAERYPTHVHEDRDLARVARLGEPHFVPDLRPEAVAAAARDAEHRATLEAAGMRSLMMVPLAAAGGSMGVLTLAGTAARPRFTEDDLDVALELGRRAGVALANAQLFEERATVAETLQRELLPPELPVLDGWTTAALYRAAGEVGGDFYDAFEAGDGWLVVMGDVTGRGPAAASLTAMARYTLRTAGSLTGDPAEAMRLLNQALGERPRMALVSVCLVHVHGGADEGRLDVLCAGHPAPFLLRAGAAEQVPAVGPLLGAVPDAEWPAVPVELAPGDQLVLYTDGVIDAEGDGRRFGEDRLAAVLAGAPTAEAAIERVAAELDAFTRGTVRDDTAVLALARTGTQRRTLRLPAGRQAPKDARRTVGEWLRGTLPPGRLEDAKLLVSELVTNGVRHVANHAGDRVDVEILVQDGHVRIEVRDAGSGFAPGAPVAPPVESPGGRGLLIVDRVASRWGATPGGHTCVWFELDR